MSEEMLRQELIERFEQAAQHTDRAVEAVTEQLIEQRSCTEFGHERLDKAFNALSGGIVRIERKLDRILALIVEARRGSR